MAFTGICIIGPLGSGKDVILSAIDQAFKKSMVYMSSWQVGWQYYHILSKRIDKSVEYILNNKGEYRSSLQEIGTTEEYVNQAINHTVDLYDSMYNSGVIPIVLGRLPREAIELQNHGAAVIFLESSKEDRISRIWLRDNIVPTCGQIEHEVEPKLEIFANIADLIIYNNNADGNISCNFDDYLGRLWFNNNQNSWSINLDA